MTFNRFNRRLHLYLALALLPWFVMYALSSLVLAHEKLVSRLTGGRHDWTLRFETRYESDLPLDADVSARRAFARRVVSDHGLDCTYGVSPIRDGRVSIWCATFLGMTRLTYDLESRNLKAEDDHFEIGRFLSRMHSRGGFEHEGALDDLWAVMVDLVCVAFVLWVASGLFMWWKVPRHRWWGTIALLAGAACFIAFVVGL